LFSSAALANTPTVIVTNGGDDVSYEIPISEPVNFMGQTYSRIFATTNAVIAFGAPDGTFWDFPMTPSISLGSQDWVAFPSRGDEHFIISYTDNAFQVDMSVRPFGAPLSVVPSRIVLTGIINADRSVDFSYYLENTEQYQNLRFGVRTPEGTVITLQEANFYQAETPPSEDGEIMAPPPTESETVTESETIEDPVTDSGEISHSEDASQSDQVTESETVSESEVVSESDFVTESESVSESEELVAPETESSQTESATISEEAYEPEDATSQPSEATESDVVTESDQILPTPEPGPEPTPQPSEPLPEQSPVLTPEVLPDPLPEPEVELVEDPDLIRPDEEQEEQPLLLPEQPKEPQQPLQEKPAEKSSPAGTPELPKEPLELEPAPEVQLPSEPVAPEVPVEPSVPSISLDLISEIDPSSLTQEDMDQLFDLAMLAFENSEPGSSEYEAALAALALIAIADDPELPEFLASIPVLGDIAGAVLDVFNRIGNVGADMSPAVRERSEKVIVAAVIVGQIAITTTATAAVAAASRRIK